MSSLPPGCRFCPSDEQLLCYYLTSKNHDEDAKNGDNFLNGNDLIKELDLYDYEPFDLPENACYAYGIGGGKRHWYCYTKKVRVLTGEKRITRRRRAKGGYWRSSGRVREVVDAGGKVAIGTRSKFVFYLGNSVKTAVRTDWVLYEYALIPPVKASYVLCRVFVKSRARNSISDNILGSFAEDSISAVRHVGVQHDGYVAHDIVDAKFHHEIQYNSDSSKLVRTMGPSGDDMLKDAETSQQLVSILEGDFIELDDLVD